MQLAAVHEQIVAQNWQEKQANVPIPSAISQYRMIKLYNEPLQA